MIAFSIFTILTITLFTLSSSMLDLKSWSIDRLSKMKQYSHEINEGIGSSTSYGNYTKVISNNMFDISKSNYIESWGSDNCNPRLEFGDYRYIDTGIDIGNTNESTDIEARNDYVYLTADSSISSTHDFFIVNASDHSNPVVISSINTGPGLSSIDIAGPYAFVGVMSSINQLQVIDISNRLDPKLISQVKVPLPTASTTAPFTVSIKYHNGYVYLGTTKWSGKELHIIDVSNIYSPTVIGGFETNTQINDIYVVNDIAYLATSDEMQMRVVDIKNKSNPILTDSFSSSGWHTQAGKALSYFEGVLSLGRTVGGFNVNTNHELFVFGYNRSIDIPGGVYGIVNGLNDIFVLTHSSDKELQIYDADSLEKKAYISLSNQSFKMSCDGNNMFFASGNSKGISILEIYE